MNAVEVARQNRSLSVQDSMDHVNDIVKQTIKQWHLAQAELPSWGEEMDRDVQQYLAGILDQARGNLTWT